MQKDDEVLVLWHAVTVCYHSNNSPQKIQDSPGILVPTLVLLGSLNNDRIVLIAKLVAV